MTVFKRGNAWAWKTRTPPRPVQRCGCGAVHWVERRPASSCRCGADLKAPVHERRQVTRSGFPTKREAAKAERDFLDLIDRGRDPLPSDLSVAAYSVAWRESQRVRALAPATVRRYGDALDLHCLPAIGDLKLSAIRSRHIRHLRDDLLAGGLKPRTVTGTLAALSSMFTAAVEDELLETNPCRGVRRPRAERTDDVIPTAAQLVQLIRAAEGTPWAVPITLSATTGMRRGEVLGLRWSDVDLDTGRLTITNQLVRVPNGDGTRSLRLRPPKSDRSRRTITLASVALDRLRQHRREQAELRLRLGAAWNLEDFVSDRGDGAPLDVDAYTAAVRRIGTSIGIDRLKVHSLRHAGATMLLEQGVPMQVVSRVLGHSTIQLTVDTYGHLADALSAQAADAVDKALGAACT